MTLEPRHRDWVKLWVKDCLLGSIREELTVEERSIWYDFLVLAGHSRVPGVICANETQALSDERIAAILNAPVELVLLCVEKFKDEGRLTTDEFGCLHITGWAKYQYSDYDRQKAWREKQIDAKRQETIARLRKQP